MSHQEEALGQTHDIREKLYLFVALGTLLCSPRQAGQGEGGLGLPLCLVCCTHDLPADKRKRLDGL